MRSKKQFIFNEYDVAEKLVLEGFPNNIIDYGKMYMIAKYFRETLGYGKVRLERELIKFCKKQDENFNPIIEAGTIKKWVDSAMRYELRQINQITITQKEVDFLNTIEKTRDRKLLFCALILSKGLKRRNTKVGQEEYNTSDKYYIKHKNFTDIVRMSKLSNISEMKFSEILFDYQEYFLIYNPEKELLRLEYADPEEGGYVIDNLQNPMKNYDEIFTKNNIKNKDNI